VGGSVCSAPVRRPAPSARCNWGLPPSRVPPKVQRRVRRRGDKRRHQRTHSRITSPGKWRPLNGLVGVIGMELYPTRPHHQFRYETPKVLTDKVSLSLAVHGGQMNRTLSLDISDHLRNRLFGGNRNHHVHVIVHQVPSLDPAFLLLRQGRNTSPKMLPQSAKQGLPPTFRNEHHVI
jgi:hypothetical protein